MNRLSYLPLIALFVAGCGLVPEKVEMSDPRVQSLLETAASFNRTSYGFSPIPNEARDVRLELRPRPRAHYDAMLHIDARTSRTIAFRKTESGYKWIGEQESFQGPKRYTTVDGTFYEAVTLNYDLEKISGFPTNALAVIYSGEDPRLANRFGRLVLNDVEPILREWGY